MLLPLDQLVQKYKLNIKGIIHCGAHIGEEYPIYQKLNIPKVLWIEANEELIPGLEKRIKNDNHLILNTAVSDKEQGEIYFYYTNQTQSSSLYNLGLNKQQRKGLEVREIKKIPTTTLDYLFKHHTELEINDYNLINLDIQGGELKALSGFKNELKNIDYIYCEAHKKETYEGVPQLDDLLNFLEPLGFKFIDSYFYKNKGWGDIFLMRQ